MSQALHQAQTGLLGTDSLQGLAPSGCLFPGEQTEAACATIESGICAQVIPEVGKELSAMQPDPLTRKVRQDPGNS